MNINFSTSLAEKLGLNEAIVVSILDTLIQEEGIEIEDSKWVALSYKRLKEVIPFFSCTTIRRTVCNLEKQGLIKTRTAKNRKWYALNISVRNEQEYQENKNENLGTKPAQTEQENQKTGDRNEPPGTEPVQYGQNTPDQNKQSYDHDQSKHQSENTEIQAFSQAVQNGQPNNNNCRKIYYNDQDNLKPDQDNSINETTTNKANTLNHEPPAQNRQDKLSPQEIKNLLLGFDIDISWNKRAWLALKQLSALTRDEILKLAKRLFSLQCEGVVKNPAGLLVAKPAEIIYAFFNGTLYPSHTAEHDPKNYFPLCAYAA